MVRLKTPEEIEQLAAGGAILARILDELSEDAMVGITGKELDTKARRLIKARDATPSFLNYAPRGQRPFPAALIVSINEGLVHGVPTNKPFADGDVVKLDLGLVYNGLYLDSARTVIVGRARKQAKQLVQVTHRALALGIAAAKSGAAIGDIGWAVQEYVEGKGYGVVRQLVGHGVGYAVHEEPNVPNFGQAGQGLRLEPGLVIAIEPMVTIGDPAVTTGADGWTVVTASGNLAAHEEHTVAITEKGPRVLTVTSNR